MLYIFLQRFIEICSQIISYSSRLHFVLNESIIIRIIYISAIYKALNGELYVGLNVVRTRLLLGLAFSKYIKIMSLFT